MTSRWLESPAVALVCFLAAVVTLGQLATATARGTARVARASADQRRAWLALVLLATSAAALLVSWHPVVAEATRYGEPGLAGELYPVMVPGLAVGGSLTLLVAASAGHR